MCVQRTTISDVDVETRDRVEVVSPEATNATAELSLTAQQQADTYWCFSRLLDGIQDHYTFAQPGIQRMVCVQRDVLLLSSLTFEPQVVKLHDVVARVDRYAYRLRSVQGLVLTIRLLHQTFVTALGQSRVPIYTVFVCIGANLPR